MLLLTIKGKMWFKSFIIFLLFYFFAVLQGSFFIHFNVFGAVPNFILIFLFLIIFFSPSQKKVGMNYLIFVYIVIAGLFLDIFSSAYFGVSVVLLLIIGFLAKRVQDSLREKDDQYPFIYFVSIFLVSLILYNLLLQAYFYFLDPSHITPNFGFSFFAGLIYNLIFAIIGFFVYKKIVKTN